MHSLTHRYRHTCEYELVTLSSTYPNEQFDAHIQTHLWIWTGNSLACMGHSYFQCKYFSFQFFVDYAGAIQTINNMSHLTFLLFSAKLNSIYTSVYHVSPYIRLSTITSLIILNKYTILQLVNYTVVKQSNEN